MAFIIVEKGHQDDIGKKFPLEETTVLIGRGSESNPDISLNDEFVSRRHAEISFRKNRYLLRDLHSTNGTTLDQVRIDPGVSYPLKQDAVIGLGIVGSMETRVLLRFKASPTISTTRIIASPGDISLYHWLKIDREKDEIWVDKKSLTLSRKEYDFLCYLSSQAGKVCQRDEIIARVWPEVIEAAGVSDAAIDQLVHRLRQKIEPDPSQPKRLISRKGFGYMLV